MTDQCQSCRFWVRLTASHGRCHRFPPSVPPKSPNDGQANFPLTAQTDWCGEFQKPPKNP